MISKKYRTLIERRLARLEKAVNEGMRCESLDDDIDEMAHDWFISQEWDEDDYWVKVAGGKFEFIQNIADKAADPVVDACCDAIGVDTDSPERDIVENSLANAADTALVDPGYWDDDDYYEDDDDLDDEDEDDDDEDDMYESRRRKLERRVRVLERKLVDEGILDGIKNLAGKISDKVAGAKLSAEELVEKVKENLAIVVSGITNKIDDTIGMCDWAKPRDGKVIQGLKWIGTKDANGLVTSASTGSNSSLPHTRRDKDTVSVEASVNTDNVERLKDCVVTYSIKINPNSTNAKEAASNASLTGSAKLFSLLDSSAWNKIVQKFYSGYYDYVQKYAD